MPLYERAGGRWESSSWVRSKITLLDKKRGEKLKAGKVDKHPVPDRVYPVWGRGELPPAKKVLIPKLASRPKGKQKFFQVGNLEQAEEQATPSTGKRKTYFLLKGWRRHEPAKNMSLPRKSEEKKVALNCKGVPQKGAKQGASKNMDNPREGEEENDFAEKPQKYHLRGGFQKTYVWGKLEKNRTKRGNH